MPSVEQFYSTAKIPSTLTVWRRNFLSNKLASIALLIVLVIAAVAIFADFIAPYSPTAQVSSDALLPPTWYNNGSIQFILGTDEIGRDIFSRLVHGSKTSLLLAIIVVAISATGGIFIGVVTSFSSSLVDSIIMRIMDFVLALPSLLLAVVIVALIGPGTPNSILAVSIALIPHFVLVTRTAISEKQSLDYVTAFQLDGSSKIRLFFYAILPNILPPIVIQMTFAFSTAILEIAALGFLGLGVQSPTPEWGTILSESRNYISFAPWTVTIPGLAILIAIVSINLVGDGLRDSMEIKDK